MSQVRCVGGMTRARRSRKEAKAPPQDAWGIHKPEKFREFIEILEACQGFISSSSPVKIRLAIILLDNLAEVLMYHKCKDILEHDDYFKRFVAARYSNADRDRVDKDFAGKVWFLSKKVDLLPGDDATVLRVGHAYRNAAFHRDEHNPQANRVIVVIAFEVACRLLSIAYGDNTLSGRDESVERWLRTYGIDQPYLEYGPASRHIGAHLLKAIAVSDEDVKTALACDLHERWQLLVDRVLRELPLQELVLDEILKTEEFDAQFDDDSASESIREATRLIGKGETFSRKEYDRREREYWMTVRTAYAGFTPTLQWRGVQRMETTFRRLGRQRSPGRVFAVYEELSDRLAKAEHLFASAIRKNDAAAEMESDIARGK